jgi:uncharacterized protein Veg
MLRTNEFDSSEKMFKRVREIYARDLIPILRSDESMHDEMISFAYADVLDTE